MCQSQSELSLVPLDSINSKQGLVFCSAAWFSPTLLVFHITSQQWDACWRLSLLVSMFNIKLAGHVGLVDPFRRSGSSLSLPWYFRICFLCRVQHPPPHSQVQPQERQPQCQESSALLCSAASPQSPFSVLHQLLLARLEFLHFCNDEGIGPPPVSTAETAFHWNCLFVGYVLNLPLRFPYYSL